MRRLSRPLAPSILLVAFVAMLLFAATAAAEIKIGEGTSPENTAIAGEADLLKGTAEFDLTTGKVTFGITTRAAQESTPEEKRPSIQYTTALVTLDIPCTKEAVEAAIEEGKELSPFPIFEAISSNLPFTSPPPGQPPARAYGRVFHSQKELSEFNGEGFVAGSRTVNGTTTTVSVTAPEAVNGPFTCAQIAAGSEMILFPLTTKPEPPPAPPVVTTPTPPAPVPAGPAPGVLSLGKAKPLSLKAGKWATVKLKVTNTGGTAAGQGSLSLKAPKGVVVKPGRQKLPSLLPGDSWTVSFRVKLTAKAKPKSTIGFTASSGALSASGSVLIKTKTGG
jgi:hypothetical protein